MHTLQKKAIALYLLTFLLQYPRFCSAQARGQRTSQSFSAPTSNKKARPDFFFKVSNDTRNTPRGTRFLATK